MRKIFFGALVGIALGSLGVVIAQTPTIFASIRVNGQADMRGNVLDTTGNLTLGDAVDVTGKLTTAAPAAVAGAGFNLPHGTAPNSPANGDTWTTTTGMFARINGSTVGPFGAGGGSPGGMDTEVQYNDAGSFGGDAGLTYDAMNDILTAVGAISAPLLQSSGNVAVQPGGFGDFIVQDNGPTTYFSVSTLTGGATLTGTFSVGGNISNPGGAVTIADDLQVNNSAFISTINAGGGALVIDNNSGVSTANVSASEVGYKGVPQNIQAGNYTLLLTDAAQHIYHASGAGAGDTYTIPANASVAYPVGTVLTFVNDDSNSISIAITSDTMTLAGTTTTGTRTLAENGIATAVKVTSTSWIINGTGITAIIDLPNALNDEYYELRRAA